MASINKIRESLKNWLANKVRIDKWVIDEPSAVVTFIDSIPYPSNTATSFPAREIRFEENDFGRICEAEFNFKIQYRYSKDLPYDSLPIYLGEALINNLYLNILEYPQDIDPDVLEIEVPDPGSDVVVRPINGTDTDWLTIVQPQFQVRFKATYADLDGLQPGEITDPFTVKSISIKVYRSKSGELDVNRLDRTINIP